MAFFSWLKSLFGAQGLPLLTGPEVADTPQLVLLVEEPIAPTVEFVQGAVQHVMGLSLPVGDPNATEFVTGEYPFFFVQYSRRLLQIKFIAKSYFDPVCRPVITHDPQMLQRKIATPDLKAAVSRHKGWIAVSCMNWFDKQAGDGDPYADVGKMLSAFCYEDVPAIIWPNEAEIRLWDIEMSITLSEGDPLQIFRDRGTNPKEQYSSQPGD